MIQDIKMQRRQVKQQGMMNPEYNQKTVNKMAIVRPYLSVFALNVTWLKFSKRHKIAEWIKKKVPTICYLPETNFTLKDTLY